MDDRSFPTLKAQNTALRDNPPLVPGATQAVPGEGPAGAPLAFFGEQPTTGEIVHARWWLDRKLALVRPRVIVTVGAMAGFAQGETAAHEGRSSSTTFSNRRERHDRQ